jgi:hypothetical protein
VIGAPALLVAGLIVVIPAWHRDVALAIAPAAPSRGTAVAIPPELVPPEILEAAGLDERGRPRRSD